jgi:N-acetylmuramoyl-L-alanine amidase
MRQVRTALAEIGYDVTDASDPALATVLQAFQRHWRQEAVTGEADPGTLARLDAIHRLVMAG